jgi:hypothetical protein
MTYFFFAVFAQPAGARIAFFSVSGGKSPMTSDAPGWTATSPFMSGSA